MTHVEAKMLYADTARFWLERVAGVGAQRVADVLAILEYQEAKDELNWAIRFGARQVFTCATMRAATMHDWQRLQRRPADMTHKGRTQ
jgi:hypothetical protein